MNRKSRIPPRQREMVPLLKTGPQGSRGERAGRPPHRHLQGVSGTLTAHPQEQVCFFVAGVVCCPTTRHITWHVSTGRSQTWALKAPHATSSSGTSNRRSVSTISDLRVILSPSMVSSDVRVWRVGGRLVIKLSLFSPCVRLTCHLSQEYSRKMWNMCHILHKGQGYKVNMRIDAMRTAPWPPGRASQTLPQWVTMLGVWSQLLRA